MNRIYPLAVSILLSGLSSQLLADELTELRNCSQLADDSLRLTCFDRVTRLSLVKTSSEKNNQSKALNTHDELPSAPKAPVSGGAAVKELTGGVNKTSLSTTEKYEKSPVALNKVTSDESS